MPRNRMLEGGLIQKEDATDDCWTSVEQFLSLLIAKIGVTFPIKDGEDFVIYGFQTPGEDQKGKLWVKTDRADHFAGFFLFIKGKWQRVYDHSFQDVIWKYGDSRIIEPGFALIDGTVPSIPLEDQQHIMGFYKLNIPQSTPLAPVYSYFATVYNGI